MAGVLAAWLLPPDWPAPARVPLRVVGALLIVAGAAIVVWARRSLGRAFSPYPLPPEGAERVEGGPYRFARHPMYGGAILIFAGLSLFFGVVALALTAALALLWRGKSAAEERALAARFPGYAAYRERTPRRYWPGIY